MDCYAQQQGLSKTNLNKNAGEINTYVYNFGKIKERRVLKHNFILKNESKRILNILNVNTSCGCTVSKVRKRKLLPQENAVIETQFNAKGYSGPTQQQIYIHTDNPDSQILTFTIKANVVP
jgi:hypothetical protein